VHAARCPGDDKSLWVTRVSCRRAVTHPSVN
jgi:hypothetical protein